ncbi:hypothetical protein GCM10027190_07380 [Spirosoma areae]
MSACQAKQPDPEPAVSFPGGYIGSLTLIRQVGTSTTVQTYDRFTVLIGEHPHPDSVKIDLLHRNNFFPKPLMATVQPRLLTVFPQRPPTESRTLRGVATRVADSLRITLNELGGVHPVTYQIRATRLLD